MKVKDQINRLARKLAACMGYEYSEDYDLSISENPRAKLMYKMAEVAYEELTGDRPDYAEDEDEE